MTLDPTPRRPAWKEPMIWLIAGLPAIAVVASFTTYFIAAHEPDSLVREEHRKVGLAMVAPLSDAEKAAAGMGLSARLTRHDGRLELTLSGNLSDQPQRLALNVVHPTRENQDLHILLAHSHELSYIAPAPEMGSGKRILVLEPEDRSWRITGQWMAPFSGMTELVAEGSTPSTTHP